MSKEYFVSVPFSGYISVAVKADSEEEAKDQAFEVDFDINFKSRNSELVELELHERIVQGNVCYAVLREVEVEEQ